MAANANANAIANTGVSASATNRRETPAPIRKPHVHRTLPLPEGLAAQTLADQGVQAAQLQEQLVWVMRNALKANVTCGTRLAEMLRAHGSPLAYYSTVHLRRIYADFKARPDAFGEGIKPPEVPHDFKFANLNRVKAPWHDARILNDVLAKRPKATADEFVELARHQVHGTSVDDIRAWYHSELRPGHYPAASDDGDDAGVLQAATSTTPLAPDPEDIRAAEVLMEMARKYSATADK